ncbi:MAG: hypothetical protein HY539_05260 [Deltaproteobacteria bacterium]|nr:hypothetical protein [Deltaproteobacteria bacterium]
MREEKDGITQALRQQFHEAPRGKTAGFLGGIPVATDPPLPMLRISGPFIPAARRQGFLAEADKGEG